MTADAGAPSLKEAFAEHAAAAGAVVHGGVGAADVLPLVERLVRETGTRRVLAWAAECLPVADLWSRLEAAGLVLVMPDIGAARERRAALQSLDDAAAGVTGAVAALADTGTLVLASGRGRARLALLLPTRHIALLDTRVIHADMASFFADPAQAASRDAAHLAFVTGPSRTADIELTMTRGVHGPRELHIVCVETGGAPAAYVPPEIARHEIGA